MQFHSQEWVGYPKSSTHTESARQMEPIIRVHSRHTLEQAQSRLSHGNMSISSSCCTSTFLEHMPWQVCQFGNTAEQSNKFCIVPSSNCESSRDYLTSTAELTQPYNWKKWAPIMWAHSPKFSQLHPLLLTKTNVACRQLTYGHNIIMQEYYIL